MNIVTVKRMRVHIAVKYCFDHDRIFFVVVCFIF